MTPHRGARRKRNASAALFRYIFGVTGKNIIIMIKVNVTISSIKRAVENLRGKDVIVKLNLGRNKYVTFPATLNGVYPSLFTVSPADKNFLGKTAYSYSEILCGRVKIQSAAK